MISNFTRQQKLVEDISSEGWFANPAGRQGYEVILLEKVGSGGTRFYYSLKPGETLRISERLFGRYVALAVDTRQGLSFPVEGEFPTSERGHKVRVRANVRYHVIDARLVAMETPDPLGVLRDKVLASLFREIERQIEANVTRGLIEKAILGVESIPVLGLAIDGAEILEYTPDSRMTERFQKEAELHYDNRLAGIKQEAEIERARRQHEVDLVRQSDLHEAQIRQKQRQHQAFNLTDINVFLHEHPELAEKIFDTFTGRQNAILQARLQAVQPAIQAYIDQQRQIKGHIDPNVVIDMINSATVPTETSQHGLLTSHQITWGDQPENVVLDNEHPVRFSSEENDKEDKSLPDDRIKFG